MLLVSKKLENSGREVLKELRKAAIAYCELSFQDGGNILIKSKVGEEQTMLLNFGVARI